MSFKGTTLLVRQAQNSIKYYTEKFGLSHLKTFTLGSQEYHALSFSGPYGSRPTLYLKQSNDSTGPINNGNGPEHRGFGHICFSVDNIVAAEHSLLNDKVEFKKRLADGRQKDIAFALDPDGYWIELIENGINKEEGATNKQTYKFNHSMIRAKDPVKSLAFYRDILGLKLLSTREFKEGQFTLYFLAKESNEYIEGSDSVQSQAKREGIVELTHNWGTESDSSFEGYHNGVDTHGGADPGFSSFTFITENLADAVKKGPWTMVSNKLATIRDPDGYIINLEEY